MARRRRRRRHHRRGFGILYKLLSVVLISAAIVVALTLFFRVETIDVTGATRYTGEEVIDASGIKDGDNLFLLNKYAIADSIRARLPYVSSISISRRLPDTLIIEVTDGVPGGVILYENEYWTVSAKNGRLMGKQSEVGPGPMVQGLTLNKPKVGAQIAVVDGQERKLKAFLDLLDALEDRGMLDGCSAMDFSEEAVISMDYGTLYTVKLAMGEDYGYWLSRLNEVIERQAADGDVRAGVIDMSHTSETGRINFIPN